MDDNKIIKLIYTLFLGILIAIFVGLGINTFYPGPKMPDYPTTISSPIASDPTAKQSADQAAYDVSYKKYNDAVKPYNRNISVVIMIAAVSLLAISILTEKKMHIISDGVMLGGLFTLIYSIGRSFTSSSNKYAFAVTSIGLAAVIYLGYHRFVQVHIEK